MKYTMKEIAKLANVSQPTVSRVINGNTKVNPEIRKRVLKVIEAVGFQPNKAAQTLKNQYSYIIGVSVTSISNPYFMELIEALEYEARRIGYNILIHNCESNVLIEQENIRNFIARQVDGVIIVPESHDNLKTLSKLNIPTVVITTSSAHFNSVAISHEKGGMLAAEEFIQKGIRKYIYIGQGPYGEDKKLVGYKQALYNAGISFDENDYIYDPTEFINSIQLDEKINAYIIDNKPDFLNGGSNKNSIGIFCGNDIIAMQLITIAQKFGLQINKHYHIIGFDDTLISKSYRFSSIHQPIKELSVHSIKLLQQLFKQNISTPHSITMDPVLIRRS